MSQYSTESTDVWKLEVGQAMARHERLVHWVVRRQYLGRLSYAEALQAGRIGLWQALRRYDAARGCRLSTYAVPAISRAVWRAVSEAERACEEVLTACPPLVSPDLEGELERALKRVAVHQLVAGLPGRLYRVIVAHYGLAGEAPRSFVVIGRELGVTRQRVQQLHSEALLWLAHPTHSVRLRQWLGCNTRADYRDYLARQRRWQRSRRRVL